jgi:hypothetical protein
MKRFLKRSLLILLLLSLWGGAFLTNSIISWAKSDPLWQRERMSMIITSPEARPFLLGFDTVLSDFIWIKTILYFGAHYNSDRDFDWLKSMINSVIMLNPRFFPAYEFAALMVPQVTGDWEYARTVCENGIGKLKDKEERVLFYLAYIYYTEYKDYSRAADLLAMASQMEGAPAFWGQFAATLYNRAGKDDDGLLFLYALAESTENPMVKKALNDKIDEVKAGEVKWRFEQ